uniref:Uncharacterized protein n=1 Tax=Bos indicus x Bos taurus TaxID=30522 RepID=A0A4W2IKA4_BOBOX
MTADKRCGLSRLNSPGTKQATTPPHRAALGSSAGVHHGAGPRRLKPEGTNLRLHLSPVL